MNSMRTDPTTNNNDNDIGNMWGWFIITDTFSTTNTNSTRRVKNESKMYSPNTVTRISSRASLDSELNLYDVDSCCDGFTEHIDRSLIPSPNPNPNDGRYMMSDIFIRVISMGIECFIKGMFGIGR